MSFNFRESNLTVEGKILHARIHGSAQVEVASQASHTFEFDIPYTEAYMTGLEVVYGCTTKTDMHVEAFNPQTQQFETYQQYGFGVSQGEAYRKECSYAAHVMVGVRLKTTVTNTSAASRLIAVNFFLHEAI
jgi:hypothetical protein